jgi:hypothetical protein
MFGSGKTIIGQGFKIMGSVTAEGLVQVNGQIEGDLNCTSLIVSPGAKIIGSVTAEQVEVNGTVEGPIHGVMWCLNPRRMWLAISTINHSLLEKVRILRVARRKPTKPIADMPRDLKKPHLKALREMAKRLKMIRPRTSTFFFRNAARSSW